MRIETVLRICNVLKITPDEILTQDKPLVSIEQEEVMSRLSACSPKEKETALKLLSVFLQSLE